MSMLKGICPSCQSSEIYFKQDNRSYNAIRLGMFSAFRPYIFVCTNCGYMMTYVHNKHFDTIRKKWDRVGDSSKLDHIQDDKRKRKNDEF